MQTEIPYDFMPPEQHFPGPAELIAAIEEFQKSRELVSGNNRFAAPEGLFELISDERGGYILLPAARDYAFLFRGQKAFHPRCLPTLLRQDIDSVRMFVEHMRIVEFELMLRDYPAVRFFEEENLAVDYVGLAQHYGIMTDVLDLTGDIQTALFFAMCDYDAAEDCYRPKLVDKEYVAYLYAFPVFDSIVPEDPGRFLKKDLRVIGLQPFKRPGAQRGYSLHMGDGKAFKGYLYSFSFYKKDSEEYYDRMINQRHIWEKDFIVEKTKMIKDTEVFSFDALALANKRYGGKKSLGSMQSAMNGIGIHFSNEVPWRVTAGEKVSLSDTFEKELKPSILRQIVNRQMRYGEQFSPVTTISFLRESMMLQLLNGGFPCVRGYDSGINIVLNDNPAYCGFSFDLSRRQTVPDSDGRVTAYDEILKNDAADTPEETDRRNALKIKVDEVAKPFRIRPVFVPNNGTGPVYLDELGW